MLPGEYFSTDFVDRFLNAGFANTKILNRLAVSYIKLSMRERISLEPIFETRCRPCCPWTQAIAPSASNIPKHRPGRTRWNLSA